MGAIMALVWLIRHGESEANAGFPTDEQANIKITERGYQQAQQVASCFSQKPSLIVTSPFLRTKQTAQPTIDRFSSTPQVEWQVEEFNYLATARRKNTTLAERKPMAEEYWQRNDPFYVDGEGAESFAEMMSRVYNLQKQIQDIKEEFVAIFTHGMFMRAFLWSLIFNSVEVTTESMREVHVSLDFFNIPNGAILNLQTQNKNIWFGGILTSHLFDFTALNNAD
jgi:2,3-bisphosphoglycerate-dependent phosphoglycerate mutase